MTTVETPAGSSAGGVAKLLIGLLFGPLGWFVATVASGDDKQTQFESKETKETVKLKISQCVLCKAQFKPQVVDAQFEYGKYCFRVHRQFKRRFLELNS